MARRLLRLPHRFHDRSHHHDTGADLTIDGRGSRVYDRVVIPLLRGFYRRVAAEAAAVAPRGGAVLDVGTGPGAVPVELAARRPDLRVVGVDLSEDMIALARRRADRAGVGGRVELRTADAAALPFADGSFDLVVSTFSMHHWAAIHPAMAEIARVLRPGGTVWIYDLPSMAGDTLAVGGAFGEQPLRRISPGRGLLAGRLYARWAADRPAAR